MSNKKLRPIFIFCLLLSLVLAGCLEGKLPDGVIATVNKERIFLHTLQFYLDGNYSSSITDTMPTLEEVKKTYAVGASTLIVHKLAEFDLKAHGINTLDEKAKLMEEEIINDYGQEEFDNILGDSFINLEDWRTLLKGHLAISMLEEHILNPEIKISKEDVLKVYRSQEERFILPDRVLLCFATTQTSQAIEAWKVAFKKGEGRESTDQWFINCQEMQGKDIPAPINSNILGFAHGDSTRPEVIDDTYRSVGLAERRAAVKLNAAEVYSLIERELRLEKRKEAFEVWLSKALIRNRVQILPLLAQELAVISLPKEVEEPKDNHQPAIKNSILSREAVQGGQGGQNPGLFGANTDNSQGNIQGNIKIAKPGSANPDAKN